MTEEVEAWIAKAEEDRLAAEWLLQSEAPLTLPSVFHIQQGAEKLLKGFLLWKKVGFERKHDLTYLLELTNVPELQEFSEFLEELSPYAVEIRYPGDFAPPTREEAAKLLAQLRKLTIQATSLISAG